MMVKKTITKKTQRGAHRLIAQGRKGNSGQVKLTRGGVANHTGGNYEGRK